VYAQPRPYFVDPNITPYETYAEYGNPSGHAFVCVFGYGYIFYCYNQYKMRIAEMEGMEKFEKEKGNDKGKDSEVFEIMPATFIAASSMIKKPTVELDKTFQMIRLVVIFLLASVCFGRMYLGMHTLNQVLLGLVSGSYAIFLVVSILEELTLLLFKKLLHKLFEKKVATFFKLIAAYIFFTLLPILMYAYNDANSPAAVWAVWWPQIQQDIPGIQQSKFTYIKVMLDSALVGVAFGILFGLYASNGNYDEFDTSRIKISSWEVFFKRCLVYVLCVVPFVVVYLLFPKNVSYVMLYLIQNVLACIGMIFLMNAIPYLNHKFELDVHGDFLRKICRKGSSVMFGNGENFRDNDSYHGGVLLRDD